MQTSYPQPCLARRGAPCMTIQKEAAGGGNNNNTKSARNEANVRAISSVPLSPVTSHQPLLFSAYGMGPFWPCVDLTWHVLNTAPLTHQPYVL